MDIFTGDSRLLPHENLLSREINEINIEFRTFNCLHIKLTVWFRAHVVNPTAVEAWVVHDDVNKWRYWPFVRGIHRSPVNYPYKGQWRGALMFSLIWVWINDLVNKGEAGDLRRYRESVQISAHLIFVFFLLVIRTVIRTSIWWWTFNYDLPFHNPDLIFVAGINTFFFTYYHWWRQLLHIWFWYQSL